MSEFSWKLLSVQDFLNRYSQAQADSSASAPGTTAVQSNVIWQKRTVQDFFAACQWSLVETEFDRDELFSVGLSVQSYFKHFKWNAPVKSLKPAIPELPEQSPPSFDVQKFSDLF